MTRDADVGSIAVPLSLNRYTYVENNPANATDPRGRGDSTPTTSGGSGGGSGSGGSFNLWDWFKGLFGDTSPTPGSGPGMTSQAQNIVNQDSYEYVSQQKGSLEGEVGLKVQDPLTGNDITDIDFIEGKILWEDKSAADAYNPITGTYDADTRVDKQISGKFKKFLQARAEMPAEYRDAAIGFHFSESASDVDPAFRAKVENRIAELRAVNPNVTIFLQWGY